MACPPVGQVAVVAWWRSGLENPFHEANTTAHSEASWRWSRRNFGMGSSWTSGASGSSGCNPDSSRTLALRGAVSVLVGRDKELAALDRLLHDACRGPARAAFVVGEPGIGKT